MSDEPTDESPGRSGRRREQQRGGCADGCLDGCLFIELIGSAALAFALFAAARFLQRRHRSG